MLTANCHAGRAEKVSPYLSGALCKEVADVVGRDEVPIYLDDGAMASEETGKSALRVTNDELSIHIWDALMIWCILGAKGICR